MRRKEHERIVHEKDRTIARLERQNEQLLDRVMYLTDRPWTPPPAREDIPPQELPDFAYSPIAGAEDFGIDDEALTLP